VHCLAGFHGNTSFQEDVKEGELCIVWVVSMEMRHSRKTSRKRNWLVSMETSLQEDIKEGELCVVRLKKVSQEADGTCPAFV